MDGHTSDDEFVSAIQYLVKTRYAGSGVGGETSSGVGR